MKVIESSKIIYVDVDDTLVMWEHQKFTNDPNQLIEIKGDGFDPILVLPHQRHIHMIKQFKIRGHTIVVWSQGGWAWAKKVVETLGLTEHVDVVMSKPDWYMDDLPSSAFMRNNIFLHPTDPTQDQSSWDIPKK